MGNSKSKKAQKEPDKFFERVKWQEQQRDEKGKRNANYTNRRGGLKEPPVSPTILTAPSSSTCPAPTPQHLRSYDDDALDLMRSQLNNDSNAFLLNNILLSVQFFENYEREIHQIKNNPISEREQLINEAMVRQNKHVFFADRMQECVHEHVTYQRNRGQTEPLSAPRLYVIYDNVEVSEPGDTSDYSAVLDAPFYKLCIEDCSKEPGYVKLKKMEVLESTIQKDNEIMPTNTDSDDSLYSDSEKESNDSDEPPYNASKGEKLLEHIKSKLNNNEIFLRSDIHPITESNTISGRRFSGPVKQVSLQVAKNNISNINRLRKINSQLPEENHIVKETNNNVIEKKSVYEENLPAPRKSILKNSRRFSGPTKELSKYHNTELRNAVSESTLSEDTETSGYRSNSSSRHAESSETESDYGYSTITEAATPKKIELSMQSKNPLTSGALPDDTWTSVDIQALSNWSDDDDDELVNGTSKVSLPEKLYERYYYLNSLRFMNNFVDNFIINLGSGLGLNSDEINSALTQGASIYCDSFKNNSKIGYEIFPALVAAWPNAANQWIIRLRRVIRNPRTNFTYQWPTKYMVNKAIGFGCLLAPVGFRPKRGLNPDQTLQWRLIFPAAERYLESCLAHSHVRCYLFTLALHKTFMENETAKIGIDASHIKNHLFWECEDNYAKWPEDRLGESLTKFLENFYIYFRQSRMRNYFVESCNEFKSIPKPLLLKLQRRLADILEAPVMHVLHALNKLKYTKKDFYPALNCQRLYEILTCKNPLRIINPNLPSTNITKYADSTDSDEDTGNFFDKARDKQYLWKKERQRQMQERRKALVNTKKQKSSGKQEREIKRNYILPKRMEPERRRLVLEFFIPHFIAMARSSERFEAIRQAVIYLEQAQRLCILLLEEPGGDETANEYLDVVRDKLADCQRKLVNQSGYKLPPRRESNIERTAIKISRKQRPPRFENITSSGSPTDLDRNGIAPFTFVDIHTENSTNHQDHMKLSDVRGVEESKL